ncbi:hypothetical protein Dimus_030752, partial [Dionaea muscipula]
PARGGPCSSSMVKPNKQQDNLENSMEAATFQQLMRDPIQQASSPIDQCSSPSAAYTAEPSESGRAAAATICCSRNGYAHE